ncbi:MAG: PD40 domain-containing protein, partial [Deltaproteobacteria bacterium]|nr:PD40 domain-containing protein [Deltaproteobacteria bacterium]
MCVDWTTVGADAFVEGTIEVDDRRFSVEFRIWDTGRCQRLLRKRYRQDVGLDPTALARRIADDVVEAFIGVRGVSASEIAFVSDRTGSKEIYLMDADGSRQRAVTANGSINNFPSWAPDGKSIAFTSYRHRNQPNVFVSTRGRGKPQRLLTGLRREQSQYRAVFGPDGNSLAVVMSDGKPSELYSVKMSTRKYKRLTNNRSIDVSPAWSPNGEQLAYVSDRTGSPQVYIMNADGSDSRRITFNGSYNTAPTWSPDGKWIAYETRIGGQFDIWLIDPGGRTNVPLVSHPRSDEAPSWAPNSRKLVFSSTRRGRADIYVIYVGGGGKARRITSGAGNNTAPAWGPYPRWAGGAGKFSEGGERQMMGIRQLRRSGRGIGALAAMLVLLQLGGCVTVADFRRLEREMTDMKRGGGPTEASRRTRVADLSAQVDSLEAEVRDLGGRLEVLEHRIAEALREAQAARGEVAALVPPDPAADGSDLLDGPPEESGTGANADEIEAYRAAYDAWRSGDS